MVWTASLELRSQAATAPPLVGLLESRMSLSCECGDDAEWYYEPADDYSLLDTKRSRKCCSCKATVKVGDLCMRFRCWKTPNYDSIVERIYGDEQPLAPKFMCEACSDQYWNLTGLGFCVSLGDDMRALLREYTLLYSARAA